MTLSAPRRPVIPYIERGADVMCLSHVAANMRQADRDEVLASYNHTPFQALMASTSVSSMVWTGFNLGQPICVFGTSTRSFAEGTGSPWMLGTDGILGCRRAFLDKSRTVIEMMMMRHRHLYNYVDARNKMSIRWLRWLGFTIHDPAPFGIAQLPFHKFEMIAHV